MIDINHYTDGTECELKPFLDTRKPLTNLAPPQDVSFTHTLTTPQLHRVKTNAERQGTTFLWPSASHQPSVVSVIHSPRCFAPRLIGQSQAQSTTLLGQMKKYPPMPGVGIAR